MNPSRITKEAFRAKVSFGLHKGYSDELLSKEEIIEEIRAYQKRLISEKNIYLSVSLSEALIVLGGQNEPHLILNFINYPRFPLDPPELKTVIENFIKHLMHVFNQNRMVVEYHDETVMLEYSTETDPRIRE